MTAGRSTETDDRIARTGPDGSFLQIWWTSAGGVGAAMLGITAIVGWWTVSAFALPWITAIGLLVIAPLVAALAVTGRLKTGTPGVFLGAALGVAVGLLSMAVLLAVEPLAGMAGVVLPTVAVVLGAALGAAAVGIGRRIGPRSAGLLVLATIVVIPSVTALTAP
jgi:hypothetical protein